MIDSQVLLMGSGGVKNVEWNATQWLCYNVLINIALKYCKNFISKRDAQNNKKKKIN